MAGRNDSWKNRAIHTSEVLFLGGAFFVKMLALKSVAPLATWYLTPHDEISQHLLKYPFLGERVTCRRRNLSVCRM